MAKQATESNRGRRVELQGEVVANKMQKTISVLVYRTIKHEKYGKYIKKSSVIKAHDEKQQFCIPTYCRQQNFFVIAVDLLFLFRFLQQSNYKHIFLNIIF